MFEKLPFLDLKSHVKFLTVINLVHNGIDRLDSNKGYTKDNVVSCCTECNLRKRDSNVDTFLNCITRVTKNLNLVNNV